MPNPAQEELERLCPTVGVSSRGSAFWRLDGRPDCLRSLLGLNRQCPLACRSLRDGYGAHILLGAICLAVGFCELVLLRF